MNLYLYYSNGDDDEDPHGKSLASKMLLLDKRPLLKIKDLTSVDFFASSQKNTDVHAIWMF